MLLASNSQKADLLHLTDKPQPAGSAASGIFLHTGWRSSGTWLWSRCREQPSVQAFYEPLHEVIAGLRQSDLPKIGPNTWQSRHGRTAPYFAEYGALIPPHGSGVPLYQRRFAFDDFFLGPHEEDADLEAYLRSLLAAPGAAGQVAVLKFCRSLGRVGWLEQRFPDMLHMVVLRDPLAQWRSGQRLLEEERNRYFTVAPLLVLARNPGHDLVQAACEALGVRLPWLGSRDMAYGVETVWRHVRRQDAAERYRGFLAYWIVTALAALNSRAMLVDTALMGRSPEHRAVVEAAFAARLGAPLCLASEAINGSDPAGKPGRELALAHGDAAAFAEAFGGGLAPRRLAKLLGCLAVDGGPATPSRAVVRAPACVMGPPAVRAGVGRWVQVWLMVVFARALKPLRRLHGKVTRRV